MNSWIVLGCSWHRRPQFLFRVAYQEATDFCVTLESKSDLEKSNLHLGLVLPESWLKTWIQAVLECHFIAAHRLARTTAMCHSWVVSWWKKSKIWCEQNNHRTWGHRQCEILCHHRGRLQRWRECCYSFRKGCFYDSKTQWQFDIFEILFAISWKLVLFKHA